MTAPRSSPSDDAPAAPAPDVTPIVTPIVANSRAVRAADAGSAPPPPDAGSAPPPPDAGSAPPPPDAVGEGSPSADSAGETDTAPSGDRRDGTTASSADLLGVTIEGPDPLAVRVSRASSEIPPVALPASQEESPSLASANDLELAFEDPAFDRGGEWDAMFFAGGSAPQVEEAYGEADAWLERRARIAASADRRAYLARYVLGAVAFSSAVCVVALAKAAIFGGGPWGGESASAATAATTVAPSLAAVAQGTDTGSPGAGGQASTKLQTSAGDPQLAPSPAEPPAPAAAMDPRAPVEESSVAVAPAEPRAAALADDEAPPAAPPSAAPRSVAPPSAAPPSVAPPSTATPGDPDLAGGAREAARQREVSRAALDRNRVADAIAAGERAVSLDATDGEAWLILGAAYQQRGDTSNARRCYRACVSQGKRGPRSECAQMLR